MINSDNEEGLMKSPGPYRYHTSDNSTPVSASSESFGLVESFTVASPVVSVNADDSPKAGEKQQVEGLSKVEKAALELSIKKHSRALDLLAHH